MAGSESSWQLTVSKFIPDLMCTLYPGPVDPAKTLFLEQREVLIFVQNTYYHMYLVPKDRFGNAATLSQEMLIAEVRKVYGSSIM